MSEDIREALRPLLAGRQAFTRGDAVAEALAGIADPQQVIADNLLNKAMRVLADDRERARAYVERATRLPVGPDGPPVAIAAHMMLYSLVTDVVQDSDEDDHDWLDAAIEALAVADETGRCELRDVLEAIDHDYSIDAAESRRLRAALADVPPRADILDLNLAGQELVHHVMSTLDTCRAYDEWWAD
ncbi:MAG: hypothetical protein QM779_10530 [Propionicimonas sp.]|uniref:hypothetical protein n=1 Tax=Propionicimonas sp. TaxID=1955623 RepID=UPI003D1279C4